MFRRALSVSPVAIRTVGERRAANRAIPSDQRLVPEILMRIDGYTTYQGVNAISQRVFHRLNLLRRGGHVGGQKAEKGLHNRVVFAAPRLRWRVGHDQHAS